MKVAIAAVILILFGITFFVTRTIIRLNYNNDYESTIGCHWDLSERASTIAQKAEYMNKYVKALEKCHLEGVNNALFFPTPESDFSENLKALKSLQKRLIDISNMDENGFAYQTAIQQITEQEQGEGRAMTNTLKECWWKANHYTYWHWLLSLTYFVIDVLCVIFGLMLWSKRDD